MIRTKGYDSNIDNTANTMRPVTAKNITGTTALSIKATLKGKANIKMNSFRSSFNANSTLNL